MQIILTSESAIKIEAVTEFFSQNGKEISLTGFNTSGASLPEQPLNSGMQCCKTRIKYVKEFYDLPQYDFIVSIENGIVEKDHSVSDVCYVVIEDQNEVQFMASSFPINVDNIFLDTAKSKTDDHYEHINLGLEVTVGEMVHEQYHEIDPKNWMSHELFGGFDRKFQIGDALEKCNTKIETINGLKQKILKFPDFPKPGVVFQDLSKIIADPKDLELLIELMVDCVRNNGLKVDKIVGLDARGFIYGSLLAPKINAGFVMVRKKGKLPGNEMDKIEIEYGTEYSVSTFEMLRQSVNDGDNILVVDDLVATGGSLWAAKTLAEQCGGNIVGCLTVVAVNELIDEAKEKLQETPLFIVIQ